MKNTLFLFIVLCLTSMTISTGCEKAETEHAKHEKLGIRAPNCDYYPDNDCCCYIELTGGTSTADLEFCGTTNPDISTNVCGPIELADCDDVVGFEWDEFLFGSGDNANEFFCAEFGKPFMIKATGNASVRFTCEYGELNPTFVTLNITTGDKRFFVVDEGCEISECHLE